jgi:hypothetical protein
VKKNRPIYFNKWKKSFKSWCITSILLLSLVTPARDPGDWVGNGASFSENLVLFAFENLEFYLRSCLIDSKCLSESQNIDPRKPDVIKNILMSIQQEKTMNPNMIQFASQSSLFIIDGKYKVAVTGLRKGDTVFVNRDMLYELDSNNKTKAISLLQLVSILIHEFGHHQGIVDHQYLDKIGSLVANQTRFESVFIQLHPQIPNLGVQFVSPKIANIAPSKLALMDDEKFLDLTGIVNQIVQCPKINSLSTRVVSTNLWNVYWQNPMSLRSHLISYLALKCEKENGEIFDWIGDRIIVEPSIEKSSQGYRFQSHNLRVYVEPCNRVNGECETLRYNFNLQKNVTKTK